jgi:predicted outer membrane protein
MIRSMVWATLSLVGVGLWLAPFGLAQAPQLADADQAFIKMAAGSGQAEIQLGKLAAERADRAEVRDFAKRLEKDHTQANLELLKILRCPAHRCVQRHGAVSGSGGRIDQAARPRV